MRIAYRTTDEVHHALARTLAEACGAAVNVLSPKEAPAHDRYDAVLHDLDDVPRFRRREIITQLLAGPSDCPRAVHGYDLTADQVQALRQREIGVFRHLEPELFRSLRLAVDLHRARSTVDDIHDGDTWIMLAG
jgi:hypothetical protein